MSMTTFTRRRTQKTDYVQRLALLKSGKPRVVIRRSLNGIRVQIISSESSNDKTLVEVTSKNLRKYGWKGHGGNISAAYLTGLLAGTLAQKHHIKEAVVDIGLQMSVKASSIYAAAVGVKDSGIHINVGKEIVPDKDRISGKHVAAYAEKLKKENHEKYKKQFSAYIKNGLEPEHIQKHFEEVKKEIANAEHKTERN
jgi:large subunit ribosomal protein L18